MTATTLTTEPTTTTTFTTETTTISTTSTLTTEATTTKTLTTEATTTTTLTTEATTTKTVTTESTTTTTLTTKTTTNDDDWSILILYDSGNLQDPFLLNSDGSKYNISNLNYYYLVKNLQNYSCLFTLFFSCSIQFSGWRVLEEFIYGHDTQVQYSCSTVLMGKMWIFGGKGDYKRQLSSVGKCGLKSEGSLPFDLYMGAANTVDGSNGAQTALLCFNERSPYVCHS